MSAGTVREWIALTTRYMPTASNALSFELEEHGQTATLNMREHVELGSAHDIAVFSLVVGMRTLMATLTGRDPGTVAFDLPIAKPAYFERFAHLLPHARFDQDGLRMIFDARALDLPLVAPDRAALRLAQEACERQLADLGLQRDSLQDRVRKLVLAGGRIPSVEEVARALHVSTRTLKRKLAAEETSFTELLDRERHDAALRLLRTPELSLEEIASKLGYSNATSFARAFRRWTGDAPTRYRARQPS
jgi:AraC-like DNA-binding protein